MRIGLVGYGVGGRLFHAPYIQAADGAELVGVVARAPERRTEVTRDLPGVPIYPSLTALLEAEVDAVTITTPPQTRRELVLEAVAAGVLTWSIRLCGFSVGRPRSMRGWTGPTPRRAEPTVPS